METLAKENELTKPYQLGRPLSHIMDAGEPEESPQATIIKRRSSSKSPENNATHARLHEVQTKNTVVKLHN